MPADQSTIPINSREISGFPGYRVDVEGNVWSCWKRGCKPGLTMIWRKLKPIVGKLGYHQVGLRDGSGIKCMYIHTLVLEAFRGHCQVGMQCRHFPDRDPRNNRLSNLQWGTQSENEADKIIHGTATRGEQNSHAKLTEAEVRSIRIEHATGGMTHRKLGEKYGISRPMVSLIVNRQNWSHID